MGMGSSPIKMLIPFDHATTLTIKLCSRLSMVFGGISAKNGEYLNHILGKLNVTYDLD